MFFICSHYLWLLYNAKLPGCSQNENSKLPVAIILRTHLLKAATSVVFQAQAESLMNF